MSVAWFNSASELDAREWGECEATCSLFSTLPWLRMREGELPDDATPTYLCAYDGGHQLLGLTAYSFTSPPHPLYAPRFVYSGILDEAQLTDLDNSPLVIAAGYSEFFGEVLASGHAELPAIWAGVVELGEAVTELAHKATARHVAFDFLTANDVDLVVRMFGASRCLVAFHDVDANVELDYQTFEGYFQSMGRVSRKTARRELRDFISSGKTVEELRLSAAIDIIAPLNSELMVKYGHDYTPERSAAVFERQARFLDDMSSVLIVRDQDDLTGFILRYVHRDELWSRVAGFKYGGGSNRDYFALHHDEVRRGLELGLTSLHLGQGTLEAKLVRGASPRPLYCVLVTDDAWPDTTHAAATAVSDTRLSALEGRFGTSGRKGIKRDQWIRPVTASGVSPK